MHSLLDITSNVCYKFHTLIHTPHLPTFFKVILLALVAVVWLSDFLGSILEGRGCDGLKSNQSKNKHDDVIKWKHFPRYWPFVRGIHRSPVNSPHKGRWRGALMFSLVCAWIKGWVNNRGAGDLRRHRANYDATMMNKARIICIILEICSVLWIVHLQKPTQLRKTKPLMPLFHWPAMLLG